MSLPTFWANQIADPWYSWVGRNIIEILLIYCFKSLHFHVSLQSSLKMVCSSQIHSGLVLSLSRMFSASYLIPVNSATCLHRDPSVHTDMNCTDVRKRAWKCYFVHDFWRPYPVVSMARPNPLPMRIKASISNNPMHLLRLWLLLSAEFLLRRMITIRCTWNLSRAVFWVN